MKEKSQTSCRANGLNLKLHFLKVRERERERESTERLFILLRIAFHFIKAPNNEFPKNKGIHIDDLSK